MRRNAWLILGDLRLPALHRCGDRSAPGAPAPGWVPVDFPVLVCCAVASALGQLVPEAATAAPADRE